MELLTLLIAGAIAGTAAGLLGIGGGVVIVPVLSLVFVGQHVDPDLIIKIAVGTSLATIVVTAISSVLAHHRHGNVRWDLFKVMTPTVVLGSFVGSVIADMMDAHALTVAFIVFLYSVSTQMVLGVVPPGRTLPSTTALRGVSSGVGTLSAMFGIGGGALHVPFFTFCGVTVKVAVATAAAIGLPLAASSTLGFIVMGLDEANLPPHSLGYVNLPSFIGVVASSIVFAPLGAKLTQVLPDKLIKRIFAAFLFVLASKMAYDMVFI